MNRSLTILFALTLSHSFFSPLTAQQIAPGAIIVRVYDFAGIPANETARAQQEADDIFARSNVRLTWLNCTMDSERRPADPTCNAVSGPSVLNLRLMPREMEPKNGLAKGVFGFSLMSTTGGYSSTTNVYVDRVATIADGRKCRQPVVLGAIIAHELGHLLLGIGSHSKSGLMSLPWGTKTLTAADQGTLSFSKKESSKLAKTASERIGVVIEAAFWGDPERVERLQLTLRLYNYAGVQPGVLERTKRESDRIFNGLGIEAGWLACPTSPEQISTNRVCAGPSGPTQLVLNLLPHSMSKKYGFQKGIFGFALPTGEGQPGTKISLFFKRVLDLAYYGGVGTGFEDAQAIILGHVMAHEIGHLLLGPDSHGPRGIMSFPWDKRTLTQMDRGRLLFTAEEGAHIRTELLRRIQLLDDAPTSTRTAALE